MAKARAVSLEAEALAKQSRLTTLERCSVSRAIETQYAGYDQKIQNFCRAEGLPLPPNESTDDHLAEFMDQLYLEGKGMNEGEKILASIEYHHCTLKGKMVRSRKALRGWRKEVPPESRIPVPMVLVFGMAMTMLHRGHRTKALKMIMDFDTYMRPGEGIDLTVKSLVPPIKGGGKQYQWYAIVVRPFDELRPDKVGIFDNSIPLDSKDRKWLGPLLHQMAKLRKSKDSRLFDFSAEEYRKEFVTVASMMGVPNLHPYQLRHGGAAEDLNAGTRSYQGVKARGRWQTDASVRRYTKVGKIQQLMNQLLPGGLAFCQWSVRNMEKAFKGEVQARSFGVAVKRKM
jgi:hypothetical protein